MKRYYGRFRVKSSTLEFCEEFLNKFASLNLVVLQCDHDMLRDEMLYTAYSKEHFREIPEGNIIPIYYLVVDTEFDDSNGNSVPVPIITKLYFVEADSK